MKLTKQQEAEIYCVKHGHASYVYTFWGYVHCGRCSNQIGDRLGSIFPMDKKIVIGCKDKPCEHCDPIYKKLNKMDKKICDYLKKNYLKPKFDHDKAIAKIDFGEK
jgi:thioredoxin-related protein